MAYAALSDVNKHLPDDKAQASDADITDLSIEADRLVRTRIASVVELDTVALWVDPDSTPEIIKTISGLLIAAMFYAKLVAEDEADGSAFAQGLYDQAMALLMDIRNGDAIIIGVDGIEVETDILSGTSFWPNATTQEPFFKVADAWSQMPEFGSPAAILGSFAATTEIEIEAVNFREAQIAIAELAAYVDNLEIPLRAVARIAKDDIEERFEKENDPDGDGWFELSPGYAERKQREVGFEHPILQREGDLKKKATDKGNWSVSGDSVWYSTANLPDYCAVHQFGSADFGATFHATANPRGESNLEGGMQNIPPRPFSESDRAGLDQIHRTLFAPALPSASLGGKQDRAQTSDRSAGHRPPDRICCAP